MLGLMGKSLIPLVPTHTRMDNGHGQELLSGAMADMGEKNL